MTIDRDNTLLARRTFLKRSTTGLGALALASLVNPDLFGAEHGAPALPGALKRLHFPPKAKRVIYLFMSGAPSHLDLFDPKPKLVAMTGKDLPDSVRQGQRITGMTSGQKNLLCVGSPYKFSKAGDCGMDISELLPHTAKIADQCTFIRSMFTEPINHDPAVTFFGTGNQQPGRPTMGAWLSYGLGSMNANLPAYVVLQSGGGGQPLQSRYWGSGFLPAQHGAVSFRSSGEPVLYVSNPPGIDGAARRQMIDATNQLNALSLGKLGDPAIAAQIENYELAFRMQTSVPELMDISKEPKEVFDHYGAVPGQSSFAANCILARRLVERGSRFIQLNHRDWNTITGLPGALPTKAKEVDQASAALVMDLERRGLLDETIVIWGGEFGRTAYSQGAISKTSFGRDHHPRCFTIWAAGGGFKRGYVHGETDDLGYNIARDACSVHDFHATMLNRLGVDHKKLIYRHEGRDYRLTDVFGELVTPLVTKFEASELTTYFGISMNRQAKPLIVVGLLALVYCSVIGPVRAEDQPARADLEVGVDSVPDGKGGSVWRATIAGKIFSDINSLARELETLRKAPEIAKKERATLAIVPSKRTQYQHVIVVYEAALKAQWERVEFRPAK